MSNTKTPGDQAITNLNKTYYNTIAKPLSKFRQDAELQGDNT